RRRRAGEAGEAGEGCPAVPRHGQQGADRIRARPGPAPARRQDPPTQACGCSRSSARGCHRLSRRASCTGGEGGRGPAPPPPPAPLLSPRQFFITTREADIAKKKRSQYHAGTLRTSSWERSAPLYERICSAVAPVVGPTARVVARAAWTPE